MQQRRTHPRIPCRLKVTSACGTIDGATTNISDMGVFIRNNSEGRLEIGRQYVLRIRLDDDAIEVRAEAVSSQQGVFFEQGGLRFRGIDRSALMRWYDFLARKRRPVSGRVDLAKVNLVRRPPMNRPSMSGIG